jgi:hypothetical protein
MKTIAFFVRHFSERGTEVSIYNYAALNETLLGNRSIIIGFTPDTYKNLDIDFNSDAFDRFNNRFEVLLVRDISEVEPCLLERKVDLFYMQTHGSLYEDSYPYGYPQIVPSFIHAVFTTQEPHGTHYVAIGEDLNTRFGTSVPVLPYIISVNETTETLRKDLGIPATARVFGQYGGAGAFNLDFVKTVIREVVDEDPSLYFLFMNMEPFCTHDRVIFLPGSVDLGRKRMFINTCDAMIHGRWRGETFGMAVAEFAVCGRPICTYARSHEREHLRRLGDTAILYNDANELREIFRHFQPHTIDVSRIDYVTEKTAEPVMKKFMEIVGWSI